MSTILLYAIAETCWIWRCSMLALEDARRGRWVMMTFDIFASLMWGIILGYDRLV